eukprot:TRINITY_DN11039_c0_g1_i7.p1 TRINITY_DN11039_c0_g1~~TRINITY_DN11039_c0_g1_i7.p1  ORF type:complete len:709 (+),score=106.22 TRINITY_DN11039_c0_g1_i7:1-2127(+)
MAVAVLTLAFVSYVVGDKIFHINDSFALSQAFDLLEDSSLSNDDIVFNISSGTYVLPQPLRLSHLHSHSDRRVTWQGQADTIITTAFEVTGFSKVDSSLNLWKATVPDNVTAFTDVFCNETAMQRARTPNVGQYFTWSRPYCAEFKRNSTCAQLDRYRLVYANDDVKPEWANESNVQFMVYHGWTASRHHVASIDRDTSVVTFTNPADLPIGHWPNKDSEGGGRYYVENVRGALDEPNEWYFDHATRELFVALQQGVTPHELNFYLPQHASMLVLDSTRNHVFDGISFRYSNFVCGKTQQCDRQSTAWEQTAGISMISVTNVTINNCEVIGSGSYAIWINGSSTDIAVTSNRIHDLGSGAVRVGSETPSAGVPRQITVADNTIYRGGLAFPSGTPILIQKASNVSILHNDIGYFAYAGISVGWSWNFDDPSYTDNITVAYNHVHNLGSGTYRQLGDAMAAVYTLGVLNGTRVHHNLLHDVAAWYTGGYCLSQDQGSSNIMFDHNVCHATTGASQTQHYGSGNTYHNNIFSSAYRNSWTNRNSPGIRSVPQDVTPQRFKFINNIVYADNITNGSLPLFMGDYINTHYHHLNFTSNLYWNSYDGNLSHDQTFGGCRTGEAGCATGKLSWYQWTHGCGTDVNSNASHCVGDRQDQGSLIADPQFTDLEQLNFTMPSSSPAFKIGFEPIDLSLVGPRNHRASHVDCESIHLT